jgi:hypothetical protein
MRLDTLAKLDPQFLPGAVIVSVVVTRSAVVPTN